MYDAAESERVNTQCFYVQKTLSESTVVIVYVEVGSRNSSLMGDKISVAKN